MGADSKIEWTDHTANFWWGCTLATLADGSLSEECRHCYAKGMAPRFSKGKASWGPHGLRWDRSEAAQKQLAKLDESARKRGVRERVFINSMSDTFEGRDILDDARAALFRVADGLTNLDLQLLTKRPGNVLGMVPAHWLTKWPAHVWMGTTCGTQHAADERIPELLRIPARVRFLSCEPLLSHVDIPKVLEASIGYNPDGSSRVWSLPKVPLINWVICGGESGAGARPMHPDLARSLRDQCQAAEVPFFFKQWGEFDQFGKRVGKKAAGRVLDGRTWDDVPQTEGVRA